MSETDETPRGARGDATAPRTYALDEAMSYPGGIGALTGGAITGPYFETGEDDEDEGEDEGMSFRRPPAQPRDACADGYLMLTVPAHLVRPGDIITMSGAWCTVECNDDSTEGETSARSILAADRADGRLRTLGIIALVDVAVLRRKESR